MSVWWRLREEIVVALGMFAAMLAFFILPKLPWGKLLAHMGLLAVWCVCCTLQGHWHDKRNLDEVKNDLAWAERDLERFRGAWSRLHTDMRDLRIERDGISSELRKAKNRIKHLEGILDKKSAL
jgi:septal ring factor EnvC (AmiA/AmiB activator)